MTALTPKEREDLQSVFNAISSIEPSAGAKWKRLKLVIRIPSVSHLFSRFKKRASYQK